MGVFKCVHSRMNEIHRESADVWVVDPTGWLAFHKAEGDGVGRFGQLLCALINPLSPSSPLLKGRGEKKGQKPRWV